MPMRKNCDKPPNKRPEKNANIHPARFEFNYLNLHNN